VTGHSFVAEASYAGTVGRDCTRVVSCNTTSIVRVMTALKRAGLLRKARGTLLRRATDPWESHMGGIMNTLVPEAEIPSHQGPDAQSVDPELDVVTMAVKVPETLAHLHYWAVQLTRPASKDEVIAAFRTSSRIALIQISDGLTALNTVKELMADFGRPHGNLYEVALWGDMLKVDGDEAFFAYMVDNQAIVIPETIDAIRALSGSVQKASESIAITDAALGMGAPFV
jgi:glyceraldehyde-3-phosphate dehydrogenase (NAD(P))